MRKAWGDDEGEWLGWENEEEKESDLLLASAKGEKEENEIFVLDTLNGESDIYLLIGGFLSYFKHGWFVHFRGQDWCHLKGIGGWICGHWF